eukprot:TRINITY_DN3185_c1_g1_i1.p1 TRINITY_DN3185_c1_g1~~TRINITY_DN3185_c1_g1_i1.p1  ORF type:complete len:132 (+),score=25.59 TRINITY_DN3185_c1_g1_i1:68-463(+)
MLALDYGVAYNYTSFYAEYQSGSISVVLLSYGGDGDDAEDDDNEEEEVNLSASLPEIPMKKTYSIEFMLKLKDGPYDKPAGLPFLDIKQNNNHHHPKKKYGLPKGKMMQAGARKAYPPREPPVFFFISEKI